MMPDSLAVYIQQYECIIEEERLHIRKKSYIEFAGVYLKWKGMRKRIAWRNGGGEGAREGEGGIESIENITHTPTKVL